MATNRRRLISWSVLMLLIAVGVTYFTPAIPYSALGWCRGEAFFDGKPTGYWILAIRSEDATLRFRALPRDVGTILRKGGQAAVPVLLEMARSDDARVRAEALQDLNLIRPEAAHVTPTLIEIVSRENNAVTLKGAADLLLVLDEQAATRVFIEMLRSDNSLERRGIAAANLARLSRPSDTAVAALREALGDPDLEFRLASARSLWKLTKEGSSIVPSLAEGLEAVDLSSYVRVRGFLDTIGSTDKEVASRLMESLKDPDPDVRRRSAQALGYVSREPAAVQALLDAWKDPVRRVRTAAVVGLAAMREGAKNAVPVFIHALKDEPDAVRVKVLNALGAMCMKAEAAVPAVIDVLQNKNKDQSLQLREQAIQTLRNIGPAAKPATGALTEVLKDPALGPWAAIALAVIHPEDKAHLANLLGIARTSPGKIGFQAALAAEEIVPGLAFKEGLLRRGHAVSGPPSKSAISSERRGTLTLTDPEVIKTLQITDHQLKEIQKINHDTFVQVRKLFDPTVSEEEGGKKREELWKLASEMTLKLLSDEQKAKWKALQAKQFTSEGP